MAQRVRLESGFIALHCTEAEQARTWKELSADVSPVGKHALFTPRDNLEYFIHSERELSFEKYEAKISANGKTFKVKYNVCNQHAKTYKAVREAFKK